MSSTKIIVDKHKSWGGGVSFKNMENIASMLKQVIPKKRLMAGLKFFQGVKNHFPVLVSLFSSLYL